MDFSGTISIFPEFRYNICVWVCLKCSVRCVLSPPPPIYFSYPLIQTSSPLLSFSFFSFPSLSYSELREGVGKERVGVHYSNMWSRDHLSTPDGQYLARTHTHTLTQTHMHIYVYTNKNIHINFIFRINKGCAIFRKRLLISFSS